MTLRKTVRILQNQRTGFINIDNSNEELLQLLLKSSDFDSYLQPFDKESIPYYDKRDITCKLVGKGFDLKSLQLLEYLADSAILDRIPEEQKPLKRNETEGLILYLKTWAEQLEEQFLEELKLIEEPSRERFYALL